LSVGASYRISRSREAVGGVCPFGLATPLPVFCDITLRDFVEVIPAAGSPNSAMRLSPARLVALTGAEWVDVCADPGPAD